jgi:hypothetical protein
MLDFLAEQRIVEAVSRGELDNLPGTGKPLALDDHPLVPEELRLDNLYYERALAKLGR